MARIPTPKIGDCFEILLPDGRRAYGRYVFWDGPPNRPASGLGSLVQIYDVITYEEVSLGRLRSADFLFPPVFTGLKAAIRSGIWRIVGHLPVEGFIFPQFRSTFGTKPGVYHDWKIWDGEKEIFIGDLPPELRSLEAKAVWGCQLLEDRIATGINRYDHLL